MDYVLREFGTATDWNLDNSFAFLTATSDNVLSFQTPTSATLNVSSLGSNNFANSYTLSTLGQLDGTISYLYSNVSLGHVPASSTSIPLRRVVEGYRDVPLPVKLDELLKAVPKLQDGRKPTVLHATLALPPPSSLTALYARRVRRETLLSIFLNSKTVSIPAATGPPPASVLAHIQHDTGRYSIEGLASTDNALLGVRGLWNFGIGQPDLEAETITSLAELGGSPDIPISPMQVNSLSPYIRSLTSKPSLLSAGAEFYYTPYSHVIGLSTGLRFTTLASHIKASDPKKRSKPLSGTSAALTSSLLAPANIAQSSFPYTMTLTLNPLIGALASTYSVKATSNLSLSSRFDFNIYSWESQYTFGAEIWRGHNRRPSKRELSLDGSVSEDKLAWLHRRTEDWFTPEERALKDERLERANENVVKVRVDDGWNVSALWTGRLRSLLVSAGFTVSPVDVGGMRRNAMVLDEEGRRKRFTGKFGVSVSYST